MTMHNNEFFQKKLVEKTDLYDNMDSILDLRGKYTVNEMNQLKSQNYQRNNDIRAQNMKNFYKIADNRL